MSKIFLNQVGFQPDSAKKAVLDFEADEFKIVDDAGNEAFKGRVIHFGKDEISGEDTYVADFGGFYKAGRYHVEANGVSSPNFEISENVYDKLMKDICKCFYYLRCGDALDRKYAGEFYHEPCHMSKATVYGEDTDPVDVTGGWHDAGDYGRYSTAGAVAVAHLLYGVRFFDNLLNVEFDIPKVQAGSASADNTSISGYLPDILAEVKVELDFLMKMQRENGSVWHKVTTFCHAPFIMPEEDTSELFLFNVSSMATADIAAVFALAYTIYRNYDAEYADKLMDRAKRAYKWLQDNPEPLLFKNAEGSNTGEYGEAEDISNRFWAACALYEATGEKSYYQDAETQKERLGSFDKAAEFKGYQGDVFTCLGWAEVAGLGCMSLLLSDDGSELFELAKKSYLQEADRLCDNADKNGFGLCMDKKDFIWGSNMELLKYLMVLTVAEHINSETATNAGGNGKLAKSVKKSRSKYESAIIAGIDYLLGCNSMDVSYVTGNGEKAFKNPHLRPTAIDDIEQPWPGLVSGGPNVGLQDERAQTLPKDLPPMKCYLDHIDCYSLNEITIYWNSPLVFVMAGVFRRMGR